MFYDKNTLCASGKIEVLFLIYSLPYFNLRMENSQLNRPMIKRNFLYFLINGSMPGPHDFGERKFRCLGNNSRIIVRKIGQI